MVVRESDRPAQDTLKGESESFRQTVAAVVGGQGPRLDSVQTEVAEGMAEYGVQCTADNPSAFGGGVDPEPDLGRSRRSLDGQIRCSDQAMTVVDANADGEWKAGPRGGQRTRTPFLAACSW